MLGGAYLASGNMVYAGSFESVQRCILGESVMITMCTQVHVKMSKGSPGRDLWCDHSVRKLHVKVSKSLTRAA